MALHLNTYKKTENMNEKYNNTYTEELLELPGKQIRQLSPELIPHSEFHTGIWLQPTEKNNWYYFSRKLNLNRIENKQFLSTVDAPLKELVSFLHSKNIRTTPSCSGHHNSERDLQNIYYSLENDRDEIVDYGLPLLEVESGERFFYRNMNYDLPWSKVEFVKQLREYQEKGVLGMRLDLEDPSQERILNLNIDGVSTGLKDSITFIYTGQNGQGYNEATWKKVTEEVKKIIA
jgi:hypothetical protein